MPQKTNLNINPYYDDFDKANNFYRVLFKPGYPIQARELTTLQSILQSQIESFGSHIFKEGSMVIPGGVTYDRFYEAVKINPTHFGLDLNIYLDKFVGKKISGGTSGVTGTIQKVVFPPTDGIEFPTLYVKYLNSNRDFQFRPFSDGETLIAEDSVTYGNTTISAGDSFASVIDLNATATSSAVHVSNGIYFIRGVFASVQTDTIVLDPYKNDSSYRVGLVVNEELVSAGDESSLYDNARGFSNFAAPGADRLKITAKLGKKAITDFDDKNFVELVRIVNGEIKKLQDKTTYSIIRDYFAKRTFDESGNYTVNEFTIDVEECLNDKISNNGIYTAEQKTEQLNDPSEDLVCARVSSGTAYVRGYDVDFPGSTILDLDKPRDTTKILGASVPFKMGNLLKVNNVQGSPVVGINNTNNVVTLQSRRKSTSGGPNGVTIGQARVYSFSLNDISYTNDSSQFDLYLYDVQTYTTLTLSAPVSSGFCPASSYIKGLSSGATGYVVNSPGASSLEITVTQTSGEFIVGEQISFNEGTEYIRSITAVDAKNIKDIKSVYQTASAGGITTDFSGDTVLESITPRNFKITDKISISPTGIASCAGKTFSGISTNTIIRYQRDAFTTETFARVVGVSSDLQFLTLTGVATVTGVNDGGVVGIDTVTTTFTVGEPRIRNERDAFLYSKLSSPNVASLDLSDSTLTIVHQETGKSTSALGELSLNTANIGFSSAFFEPFESKSYSIAYTDGTFEPLDSSQVTFGSNGTTINFSGLRGGQSDVTVNTTIKRQGIVSKQKTYDRSHQVVIDKSVSGISTSVTGLSTTFYYGLRVEDREISLNTPDVVKVLKVYESLNKLTPTLNTLQFVSGLGLDVNAIIGEKIIGKKSNAVAQIVTKPSATEIGYVPLNANNFQVGETVTFEESSIVTSVQSMTQGSYLDVTDRFTLDSGQKEQYYDYSKLVRNNQALAPSKKLLVICNRYVVPANDNGDFYTVNSYDKERYSKEIPSLKDGTRLSDILDFRPRVADFSTFIPSTSPFDFASRAFGSSSVNTTLVSAPNESSVLGVEYYLGRIDKIILDIEGNISVVKGTSAQNPKEPTSIDDTMTLAVIKFPPYLFNPDDAEVSVIDNKRFTMKDIGELEDRIDTLETVTSLSLLELNTQTLQIQDAQGLNRFKSGFFVDDFADNRRMELSNFDAKADIDARRRELLTPIDVYSLELEPAYSTSVNTFNDDLSQDLTLLDTNVQKTGDLITLRYDETSWLEQPLASRSENVNPFNMIEFVGRIVMTPATDNWTRTVIIPGGERRQTGNTARTFTEDILISSEPDTFMRSRNVQFQAGGLRPVSRFYPFMDGIAGIDVIPKLIEVSMVSGTFNVGENVEGFVGSEKLITFRTAQPNHKDGPYNNPEVTYNANPYNTSEQLTTQYSASGTVVNVDTRSLSNNAQGTYFGYITTGMSLVGADSGATATVTDVRLITDTFGDLIGSFFIRDPNTNPPPTVRIKAGDRTFRVTTSESDAEQLPGSISISHGEGRYAATGIVETFRQDTVVQTVRQRRRRRRRGGKDPLAQSFTVDETGAFLTSVDLYFSLKDENEKVFVEVREVELGTPTDRLVHDYARAVLYPSDITTSTDASVATNVKFPSPIYLQQNREYAIVLLAPTTNNYEVWIAQMGERTVNGQNLPDAEAVIVTKQYIGGSLFKSQNGTIWTPSQFEDMKFKLYKANFIPEAGTAFFYNPSLDTVNENVPRLQPDAVKVYPRKIDVGITSSTLGLVVDRLVPGTRVKQSASLTNGYIENVGGGVSFTGITTANVGAAYSAGTYTNVNLYPITGRGRNLMAETVTFKADGTLDGIILNTLGISTGNGWATGDVIGITTADVGNKGSGARMTIRDTVNVDTLYLTNVQGDNFTVGGNLQIYVNDTVGVSLASTIVTSSTAVGGKFAGNVVEFNHYNHGMSADNNVVDIQGIAPDTVPTTLSVDLDITDTQISLADTTSYSTFEGITTASGYLKVNNEIIYYNSIGSGVLGIATRGVSGTAIQKHFTNDPVYKYEVADVSLVRINAQHDMAAGLSNLRDIDTYHIEFNRGGRSSGESMINFRDEANVGGKNIRASRNVQFNMMQPQFDIITPGRSSSVTGTVRTVSGTSAGGAEPSFIDQGFEAVQINDVNELSTTRLVCSQINETTRLTALPKNRSLTVGVSMSRDPQDPNLSPAIDTQTAFAIFGRNRLNKPITDYVNDSRSNQLSGDPHSAVYITNRVTLEQPATSLKVFVGAYKDASADFRVMYRLFKADSSEVEQAYVLFPGYDNMNDTDQDGFGDTVVDASKNSGRADALVAPSNIDEFNEYQFSIENLEQFTGYQIKLVMSGTNEARAPRFKDLRAIALA